MAKDRIPYVPGGTTKAIEAARARREADKRPHIKRNGLFVPAGPIDEAKP